MEKKLRWGLTASGYCAKVVPWFQLLCDRYIFAAVYFFAWVSWLSALNLITEHAGTLTSPSLRFICFSTQANWRTGDWRTQTNLTNYIVDVTIQLHIIQKWRESRHCCSFEGMHWHVNSSEAEDWGAPWTCVACLHSAGTVYQRSGAHTLGGESNPIWIALSALKGETIVTAALLSFCNSRWSSSRQAKLFYAWDFRVPLRTSAFSRVTVR